MSAEYVLKEKRVGHVQHLEKVGSPEPEVEHEVVIAVEQNSVEAQLLNDFIPRVNEDGFEWLTFDEVNMMTEKPESQKAVRDWLEGHGVSVTWVSKSGHYLKASAQIGKWESMLNTKFYAWESTEEAEVQKQATRLGAPRKVVIQSEDYSVPKHMDEHIQAVFNTCQTPPLVHGRPKMLPNAAATSSSTNTAANSEKGEEEGGTIAPTGASDPKPAGLTTIPAIKAIYRVTSTLMGYANQRQSVFETANEYFSTNDLASFQDRYGLLIQPAQSIGGHSLTNPSMCSTDSSNPSPDCFEGNLDIQYIMGIAQNTTSVYWYTAGGNPFVEWIEEVENDDDPPKVNSISWGVTEQAIGTSTFNAFETAAVKLAIQGVTIVVASGDNGVMNGGLNANGQCASNVCTTDSSSDIAYSWTGASWEGQGYFPSWPSTSPYVTSVGASMGPDNGQTEIACMSNDCYISSESTGGVITTGGGFSTYYPTPDWQTQAVYDYFNATDATPASPGFNPNGRAIPDIALVGVKYQVVVANYMASLYGTSATAPVFAGFVSLVNAERAAAGKATIGFLNPLLYSCGYNRTATNTSSACAVFNDITQGSNKCCSNSFCAEAVCCAGGFVATEGWDPVTGWGSIKFDKFAGIFNVSAPYIPTNISDPAASLRQAKEINTLEIYIIIGASVFFCITISAYCTVRMLRKSLAGDSGRSEAQMTTQQSNPRQGTPGVPTARPVAANQRHATDPIPSNTHHYHHHQQQQQQQQQQRHPGGVMILDETISPLPLPPSSHRAMTTPSGAAVNDAFPCPTCGVLFEDPVVLVAHTNSCSVAV